MSYETVNRKLLSAFNLLLRSFYLYNYILRREYFALDRGGDRRIGRHAPRLSAAGFEPRHRNETDPGTTYKTVTKAYNNSVINTMRVRC